MKIQGRMRRENEQLTKRLSREQLQTLKGDNPFRNERNVLIRELWSRGVKLPLLVKLTGMPQSTVYRVATTDVSYTKLNNKSGGSSVDIGSLRRAFATFYREVMACMNIKHRGGK